MIYIYMHACTQIPSNTIYNIAIDKKCSTRITCSFPKWLCMYLYDYKYGSHGIPHDRIARIPQAFIRQDVVIGLATAKWILRYMSCITS